MHEVIQHLFKSSGQVTHTMLNEHKYIVKTIVYMLTEPLSTVFTQIEDLVMLAKAAKNSYSDRHLFKIAINIIRNTNDFDKGQADWYGKTRKHT